MFGLWRFLGPGYYDEIAVARKLLPGDGVMIDVGAHHGGALADFAAQGWKVLAFEPDPANRAILEEKALASVAVDPRAITETDGETLTFYTSDVSTGISSLAAFHDSHRPTTTVQTVRLDSFLHEHGTPAVDFLKVDTEGFDLFVLRTFPWAEQKPAVVICEFEDSKTVPLGYSYTDLGDYLVDKGYDVLMSEWHPIERYGTAHHWRRVTRYPAQLEDPSGWGNFIATAPGLSRRALRQARLLGRQLAAHQWAMRRRQSD